MTPDTRLIQQRKTGQICIVARTAVLSIAANRRQHSTAEHTVMRDKRQDSSSLSGIFLFNFTSNILLSTEPTSQLNVLPLRRQTVDSLAANSQ